MLPAGSSTMPIATGHSLPRRPPTAATGAALLSDPPPARAGVACLRYGDRGAAAARGLRSIADINESADDGFFAMPLSQDAQRASSARCYLTSSVRRRSNLAIMPRTRAVGLRTDGAEVRGVVAERDGNIRQLDAREVILSAGAIHSPTIMLRAGIGPADQLKGVGIVPLVDRPGVGRNLQNHLYLHFALTLPRGRRLARHLRRFAIAGIRLSSGLAGCPAGDLMLFTIGRVSPRSHGPDLAMAGRRSARRSRAAWYRLPARTARRRRASSFVCSRTRAIRRACSRPPASRRRCSSTRVSPQPTAKPTCCPR